MQVLKGCLALNTQTQFLKCRVTQFLQEARPERKPGVPRKSPKRVPKFVLAPSAPTTFLEACSLKIRIQHCQGLSRFHVLSVGFLFGPTLWLILFLTVSACSLQRSSLFWVMWRMSACISIQSMIEAMDQCCACAFCGACISIQRQGSEFNLQHLHLTTFWQTFMS